MKRIVYCCLLVGLFACKSDNDKIFSNFYIRFDENSSTVSAEAVFFKGDTLDQAKPFIPTDGVFFDGGLMEQKDLGKRGIVFRSERSVEAKPYFTYSYKNLSNQVESFDLKIPYLNNLRIDNNEIQLDSGFVLKWDGVPLQSNESLVILLNDAQGNHKNIDFSGPTSSSSIRLAASAIANLTAGNGTVAVVKKTDELVRLENIRRGCQSEYYSKPLTISFVK